MERKIKYQVIQKAVHGDAIAINTILKFYDSFLNSLATCRVIDQFGNTYCMVDEYKKRRLQTRMIAFMLNYSLKES